MRFPAQLQYTREHVWVRFEGDEAVVGVTDHAQKELGDVVYVETPAPGFAVTRGKPFGVVESVKSVSDLHAPVDGTVTRVNEALAATPELINKDPYGAGWIVAVAVPARGGAGLMSAAEYEAYVREIVK